MNLTAMTTKLCLRTLRSCNQIKHCLEIHHSTAKCTTLSKITAYNVLQCPKRSYAHHPSFPYPDIPNQEAAKSLVVHLDKKQRALLLQELSRCQEESNKPSGSIRNKITPQTRTTVSSEAPLTSSQLKAIVMFHGIPFIAFGFLDNVIMIIAGEYIDVTLGAMFGISTMAAAALGNLISDVAGVGSAGYVELLASKVGLRPLEITSAQMLSWQSRWSVGLGRSLGITIGCLIGMFPLLFFKNKDDENDENSENNTHTSDSTATPGGDLPKQNLSS